MNGAEDENRIKETKLSYGGFPNSYFPWLSSHSRLHKRYKWRWHKSNGFPVIGESLFRSPPIPVGCSSAAATITFKVFFARTWCCATLPTRFIWHDSIIYWYYYAQMSEKYKAKWRYKRSGTSHSISPMTSSLRLDHTKFSIIEMRGEKRGKKKKMHRNEMKLPLWIFAALMSYTTTKAIPPFCASCISSSKMRCLFIGTVSICANITR